MTYRVSSEYVTVRVKDELGGGLTVRGYYRGAVLPANLDDADAQRLLRKGMLEEIAPEAPAEEPKPAKATKAAAAKAEG